MTRTRTSLQVQLEQSVEQWIQATTLLVCYIKKGRDIFQSLPLVSLHDPLIRTRILLFQCYMACHLLKPHWTSYRFGLLIHSHWWDKMLYMKRSNMWSLSSRRAAHGVPKGRAAYQSPHRGEQSTTYSTKAFRSKADTTLERRCGDSPKSTKQLLNWLFFS